MNQLQFDQVSVLKKANIYQSGNCLCVSHTVLFDDGTRKTLGIITAGSITFKTSSPERMEMISGECRVTLPNATEPELFRAGQSFFIAGDAEFTLDAQETIQYVCHFEG